jgi:hypothetical protein
MMSDEMPTADSSDDQKRISDQSSIPSPSSPPAPAQVQISDTDAVADYANFCRISGMPEELLIDFGLNPQPAGTPTEPIVVNQRVVTSWHTAKRLLGALQMSVARHEAVFGVLETDIQRRIQRR